MSLNVNAKEFVPSFGSKLNNGTKTKAKLSNSNPPQKNKNKQNNQTRQNNENNQNNYNPSANNQYSISSQQFQQNTCYQQ